MALLAGAELSSEILIDVGLVMLPAKIKYRQAGTFLHWISAEQIGIRSQSQQIPETVQTGILFNENP
jgi:hypothetical protein